MENQWIMAKAVALYYYNLESWIWADAFEAKLLEAEPGREPWHPDYRKEQELSYRHGFPSHFGTLDYERQKLHLEVILAKYGEEAQKAWTFYTTGVFIP